LAASVTNQARSPIESMFPHDAIVDREIDRGEEPELRERREDLASQPRRGRRVDLRSSTSSSAIRMRRGDNCEARRQRSMKGNLAAKNSPLQNHPCC
jgi:hypothetical protein